MNSVIKRMADEAKRRLKSGYWEEMYKNREEDLKVAKEKGVSSEIVVDGYRDKLRSTKKRTLKTLLDDSAMYSKVYDIVLRENEGETVYNPIGILKDDDFYNTLDSYGREKYVFNLSDAYVDLRKKIER
ncbi:MAG: hypothetical protein IJF76_02830, partial [Clostridia bacterium]|nr:hypothetical protein [Clostridia bacterium]